MIMMANWYYFAINVHQVSRSKKQKLNLHVEDKPWPQSRACQTNKDAHNLAFMMQKPVKEDTTFALTDFSTQR